MTRSSRASGEARLPPRRQPLKEITD